MDEVDLPGATAWVLGEVAAWRQAPATEGPPTTRTVVTLNPEIVVRAQDDPALAEALGAADLSVADGVGVAWAVKRVCGRRAHRVPGVELAVAALAQGGGDLRVFLLGGRPGVAAKAAEAARTAYGTNVVGSEHGYFDRGGTDELVRRIAASRPDLVLAGLGDDQEKFLHEHRAALGAAVAIGVGGTLDVLAGEVRRMPAWTSRLGVEWLFRVGLDPKRWRRAPRLLRFVLLVTKRLPGAA